MQAQVFFRKQNNPPSQTSRVNMLQGGEVIDQQHEVFMSPGVLECIFLKIIKKYNNRVFRYCPGLIPPALFQI